MRRPINDSEPEVERAAIVIWDAIQRKREEDGMDGMRATDEGNTNQRVGEAFVRACLARNPVLKGAEAHSSSRGQPLDSLASVATRGWL